jgi:trehalose 6-phosphate phosphatase
MFFGDDETDEDGFVAVQNAGGLAVYVGPPRQNTKALHQLESPAEVGQTLALLVRLAEPDEQ